MTFPVSILTISAESFDIYDEKIILNDCSLYLLTPLTQYVLY